MSTLLHEFIRKSEEAICDSEEISRATSYDAMSKRLRFGRTIDTSAAAERRSVYVTKAEALVLKACIPEVLKLAAVLAVESTGLAKSRHGSTEEADIEAAYWRFDARRKGYAQWNSSPMSERDAFKAEMRLTVRSVREECAEQCEQRANSLRDGSAIARQCAKDIRSRIK